MPISSSATIATPEATHLIKRLCTHWAHKFEVAFDADSGFVPFDPTTSARMRAEADRLDVSVEAADDARLQRYQEVVASHLQRMARVGELSIQWQADAP
ncbi:MULTISPECIES: DUF2218 domain-containing protein [unclassified Luteimonas]